MQILLESLYQLKFFSKDYAELSTRLSTRKICSLCQCLSAVIAMRMFQWAVEAVANTEATNLCDL